MMQIVLHTKDKLSKLKVDVKRNTTRLDRIEKLMEDLILDTQEFKNEMREFKNEMREFKDKTEKIIEDMRKDHKRMNRKWGEVSNKLGSVIEDLIYPATSESIRRYFDCDIDFKAINIRKKIGEVKGEFDIVASSSTCKKVFLIEVKATVKKEYIDYFKENTIERFKKLFVEFSDYEVIPIFASIVLDENIIKYLTDIKIYAMAYREWDYVDILNYKDIK